MAAGGDPAPRRAPEVLDLCRAQGVDLVFGLPTNSALRRRVAALETSTAARAEAAGGTRMRRFKKFHDAAGSWSRVERIVARVEAGPTGCDTRFIVTSLAGGPAGQSTRSSTAPADRPRTT